MFRALLIVPCLCAIAIAQESNLPTFRGGIGFSGGSFDFHNDSRFVDDRTSAAMFLADFEVTTKAGIGGGIRYEGVASDDDLFANTAADTQASVATFFGHFTYRVQQERFAMPIRVGPLFSGLTLDPEMSGIDTTYASFGIAAELEPEVWFVRDDTFGWSLYGRFGAGVAATAIDIDGDSRDYTSTTEFYGVEAGTRFDIGVVRIGVAYVARFWSMEESDTEFNGGGGQFVEGYDAEYQGLLFTGGVVF